MKKFFLVLALMLGTLTLSAQNDFRLGLRAGSTVQLDAQIPVSKNYIEGRFGMSFINDVPTVNHGTSLTADFALYHNWRIQTWGARSGRVFLDAGLGLNIGGAEHFMYVGPTGLVKIGISFSSAPIDLSFDWSPAFNANILYAYHESDAYYNPLAMANFGITLAFRL